MTLYFRTDKDDTVIGLSEKHMSTIKDAARRLTSENRRAFQAQVALDYLSGSARQAETVFGWCRKAVNVGLHERRTGLTCLGYFSARGNEKVESKKPKLEQDIRALVEPESQADPKFQSPFAYTRITAKGMREALISKKGWNSQELPSENTIGNILNRLGYKLRRVQKTKPIKKVHDTDAIFDNVHRENQASDKRSDSLRISIDSKAKVDIGDYSRGGKLRGTKATQAVDHDTPLKKSSAIWHS